MNLRARIEAGFETWARWVYHRRLRVILGSFAVVATMGSQLPQIRFETALENFLHADAPLRVEYDAFRRAFGRDDLMLLSVETPDAFSRESLERLRALHRDLENDVPYVYEVTSLVNARLTRGEGDELIVGDLLDPWPETDAERERARELASQSHLYENLVLSSDARTTLLVVEPVAFDTADASTDDILADFDAALEDAGDPDASPAEDVDPPFLSGDQTTEAVMAVQAVIARHSGPDFEILLSGTPALSRYLQSAMQRDMARFTALGIVTIGVLLGFLFRSVAGVLLPLAIVILSVVSTVAVLAITETPISLPTQVLPSFILAMGVGASVHVLAIFFQRFDAGHEKEDAIASALGHSGLAIAMTSLTTAGALASFVTAELAPIAALGLAAPAGVGLAFVLTVVLLPALVALYPVRRRETAVATGSSLTQRGLVAAGRWALARPWSMVAGTLALCVASLLGASQLVFSHNPLEWFPEDNDFRQATELANDTLGGSLFLELLIDTGQEDGLHDPELLEHVDDLRRKVSALQLGPVRSGKTISIVDVLKETHQALNENRPEYYRLPEGRRLVAQELLLFENSGSDDLEDVTDPQFRIARFSIKAPFVDAISYGPYLEKLQEEASGVLGEQVDVSYTGLMVIVGGTIAAVQRSMATSYLIAFAVITPLMVLLIGSWRLGLVSMLPNLSPILLTLGVMGWLGLKLDTFTMLIGSIAIGLAVDDTIHFMHNYRRYFEETGDVERAVSMTLETAGQAMLFTTLVLATGFLIYTLSSMNNLFLFGVLTAFTLVTALIADLFLAPALVSLVSRRRKPSQEVSS